VVGGIVLAVLVWRSQFDLNQRIDFTMGRSAPLSRYNNAFCQILQGELLQKQSRFTALIHSALSSFPGEFPQEQLLPRERGKMTTSSWEI
jgi:hypothetical protein